MRVSLAAVALGLLPLWTPAEVPNSAAAALTANCNTCHGPGGVSPGSMPSIDGKTVDYLLGKLRGFRDGTVDNTVMSRIAKGYSDEQLQAIAAFLAQSR
jgi:sulfide dehydrogenase cytochrome subunit